MVRALWAFALFGPLAALAAPSPPSSPFSPSPPVSEPPGSAPNNEARGLFGGGGKPPPGWDQTKKQIKNVIKSGQPGDADKRLYRATLLLYSDTDCDKAADQILMTRLYPEDEGEDPPCMPVKSHVECRSARFASINGGVRCTADFYRGGGLLDHHHLAAEGGGVADPSACGEHAFLGQVVVDGGTQTPAAAAADAARGAMPELVNTGSCGGTLDTAARFYRVTCEPSVQSLEEARRQARDGEDVVPF